MDKDDMGEAEAIIKEGVQVVLENLEEYQVLKCLFLGHLSPIKEDIRKC